MPRDFVVDTLSRAVHEELFRQLLQFDAEAAANAMERTYDADDLRILQGIQVEIAGLDNDAAREALQGLLAQSQHVFGSPLRTDDTYDRSS